MCVSMGAIQCGITLICFDVFSEQGHALYLPGSRDDLYVTDLQGYSSLICAFSETRPPVSGNFSCLGGLTSFWNKAAVAEFLKNHSAEIKVRDSKYF